MNSPSLRGGCSAPPRRVLVAEDGVREENGGDGTTTMRYMHLSSASLNQAIRLLEQRDPVGGNSGATRGGPSLAAPGIMALHGKGPAALTGVERLWFGSPAWAKVVAADALLRETTEFELEQAW